MEYCSFKTLYCHSGAGKNRRFNEVNPILL